jgi:hypothetical protein
MMSFCLTVRLGFAQIPQHQQGAIYPGNFLFLPKSGPAMAVTRNAALLGLNVESFLGLYSERRFMLKDLSLHQVVFVFAADNSSFAAILESFGTGDFSENAARVSYGRKLGKLCLGIQFDYVRRAIIGFGPASSLGASIGLNWQANERLLTGIEISNPFPQKSQTSSALLLPFAIDWYINLSVSDQAGMGLFIEKAPLNPVAISFALIYQPVEKIKCRGGIKTDGFSPWLSVEYELKKFRLQIQSIYHQQLGISPGISLVYSLKKQSK